MTSTSLSCSISVTAVLTVILLNSVMASKQLPVLSEPVKNEAFERGGSSVVNLWEHGLRLQPTVKDDAVPQPKTVVASASIYMMNIVPQDTSHPLYHDGEKYRNLRLSFLLDSMIEEKVDPNNPAMKTESGLSVKNMNGRDMVFKRDQDGKLSINGLKLDEQAELSDGTQLYVVDGIIFTYKDDVHIAWKQLLQEKREAGEKPYCLGRPCY